MVTYPCPFCGAAADLESGCSGCGRPPYADAAEVLRLNGRTIELYSEVQAARGQLDEARARYGAAMQRFNAAQSQRNLLAARVRGAVAAASHERRAEERGVGERAPVQPAPAQTAPPPGVAPAEPQVVTQAAEAEPRTVQNLLFILGGLLLGSAAVVFAAVAWASFGVIGRAAILAAVTLVTLAVPLVAQRRGLRGTAETFAALGLLLVVLDGYAAWYVNLAGLADATRPSTFAGLVGAVTAAVGGGYAALTRLRGPRIAAVLALQPVLPLLATGRGLGAAGWAGVFVVLAAANYALARTVESLAWVVVGGAVLVAGPLALAALVTADGVPAAARTSGVTLLLAALVVVAGLGHRVTAHVATGVAAVLTGLAGLRMVAEAVPQQRVAAFALVAALVAAATLGLPSRVRRGGTIGAAVLTATVAFPYVVAAVIGAAEAPDRALPAWRERTASLDAVYDWQVPVALALLGAAVAVLVRHRAVAYATVVTVGLAAPAAWSTPLTVVSLVDGALLVGLAAVALRLDRAAAAALPFVALHLLLTGLVTPQATLASAAGIAALAAVVAARGDDRALSLPATVVASGLLPVAAAAACRLGVSGTARAGDVPLPLAAAFAALVLSAVGAVLLRRRLAAGAGPLAVSVTAAGVTVAAVVVSAVDGGRTPFGVLAAAALLCTWLSTLPVLSPAATPSPASAEAASAEAAPAETAPAGGAGAGRSLAWVPGAVVSGVTAVVAVVPAAVVVLFRPYEWVADVWRGVPAGVGLGTGPGDVLESTVPALRPGPAAAGLALLAAVAVLAARRFRLPVWSMAGTPVTLAAVLGCVAAEVPWPGVPAVTLAGGLITGVLAAIRPMRVNAGAVTCWFTAGAGIAGCLATEASTLAALGAVVVAGAVAGVAGRRAGARTAGWLVAAVTAGWLAFAAGRAADLPLRWTAYCVLAAAALILATAQAIARLRVPSAAAAPESGRDDTAAVPAGGRDAAAMPAGGRDALAVEAVAHAAAVVALLLAAGDLAAMAGIAGLWGLALGVRGLVAGAGPRGWFAGAAVGAELLGYWLVLAANGVAVAEAYTVPAGLAAIGAGWLARRRRPGIGSWVAYAPGLLAGFAPSLALVFVGEAGSGDPLRRLVVGAAALAVVVGGAVWRLQAPFVVGGGVLGLVALHEVAVYWDLLPRWAPLAVAGLVLVALATTYERRRRDLRRLRAAVTRMR